jgi:hypothetical protein
MSDKEMEKEIKRYLGILSEDFQHRLNLAIDGLTGKIESSEERLNQRISATEKSLTANLTAKIESSEERLNQRISATEKSLTANLTAKIEASEERLNKKIDAVAKDLRAEIKEVRQELIAHRDNTEMHAQKAKGKKA